MSKMSDFEIERDELIDTIVDIENLLIDSHLCWSISYLPSTNSYMIYISNEEDEIDGR